MEIACTKCFGVLRAKVSYLHLDRELESRYLLTPKMPRSIKS